MKPKARQAWVGLAGRMVRVTAAGTTAGTTYLGVADGHTLNLQAELPDFDGVPPTAADLIFSRDRVTRRTPVTVRVTEDGQWLAEGTVLLGDSPGRFALGHGDWQLGLAVTLASGETRQLTLRRSVTHTPRAAGPTALVPPCPDSGTLYRPSASLFGTWQLTVRAGQPCAEVVRVVLDLGRAEVVGRFVGVADPTGATAQFVRREDNATHDAAVSMANGLFSVALPLAALAPTERDNDVWDLDVVLRGRRLRVGRYLHDLENLDAVLRPVEQRMPLPGGATFRLSPFYTPAGSLALACATATPGVRA
ncbi:hypothetical protein ACFQX7_15970 [Luedemannella flava]